MDGASLVVGVDIGGTNMQFGVVDGDNTIAGRARGKTEARQGQERVIDNLVKGVHEACAAAGVSLDDIGAVGIAAAGAMDILRGVILNAPNLGWIDVALRDIVAGRLGRPIVLDNDVNGALWGEYNLGAGRSRGDALGVWVGTGIGGALVLNDRLYHGPFSTAGEIGHSVLDPNGPPGRRTVEDLCSRTSLLRALREGAESHPQSPRPQLEPGQETIHGTATIAEGYLASDPLTCEVVDRSAELLGIAIANWVTVLSLDTVIIGGGITEALGEPYVRKIRDAFEADVFPDLLRECDLRMTQLAADSALLGAALLAREAIT